MQNQFETPNFLQNQSKEEILARMLAVLPETIGKEENGWVCDLFTPVALEKARAVEFVMVEAVKNLVPKYAYGQILIEHAKNRGITRRPATYAKAKLTVKGIKGTVIPEGFQFSTASTLEREGILFQADIQYTIPESREVELMVVCVKEGPIGNVAAETILLMLKPQKGIISIINKEPAYGGFEQESEESLRQRILEYDQKQGSSFVGSPADYRRWALEVGGVGNARIISAIDDMGLVTIILTDLNGQPVSEEICKEVYNHIMRPDSYYERLAPCNAYLKVIPATAIEISVIVTILLEDDYTLEMVKKEFISNLKEYLKTEEAHENVRYAEVGAVLINTEGVKDYTELLLNQGMKNVAIEIGCVPTVEENSVVLKNEIYQ